MPNTINNQRQWRQLIFGLFGAAIFWAWASTVAAGTTCSPTTLQPEALANAARLGTKVFKTLELSNAQVAFIGRAGADLSKYGLHFSHLGFVIRDSPKGRWTVLHLLNRCGTNTSTLYDEGLINFFLDDPFEYKAVVAIPNRETQRALVRVLSSSLVNRLHEPHYNTIAHPQSRDFQNSNQWVLELVVAALAKETPQSRDEVQHDPLLKAHQPDVIHIDRLTRIGGGLFKASLTFTDHPLADRIKGEYTVITVRSVLRFLQRHGLLENIQRIDLKSTSNTMEADLEQL